MKNRIKKWFGITKLEEDNVKLRKRVIAAEKSALASAEIATAAAARVEKLAEVFVVGMDWSPSGYDRSWVVVCIRGKMERVQFMNVSNKDAKEISRFLSIFNKDSVTVDVPQGLNNFFIN